MIDVRQLFSEKFIELGGDAELCLVDAKNLQGRGSEKVAFCYQFGKSWRMFVGLYCLAANKCTESLKK